MCFKKQRDSAIFSHIWAYFRYSGYFGPSPGYWAPLLLGTLPVPPCPPSARGVQHGVYGAGKRPLGLRVSLRHVVGDDGASSRSP